MAPPKYNRSTSNGMGDIIKLEWISETTSENQRFQFQFNRRWSIFQYLNHQDVQCYLLCHRQFRTDRCKQSSFFRPQIIAHFLYVMVFHLNDTSLKRSSCVYLELTGGKSANVSICLLLASYLVTHVTSIRYRGRWMLSILCLPFPTLVHSILCFSIF